MKPGYEAAETTSDLLLPELLIPLYIRQTGKSRRSFSHPTARVHPGQL